MKKKLLAVVMCLTLSLSMSATVFAAVEPSPGAGDGHGNVNTEVDDNNGVKEPSPETKDDDATGTGDNAASTGDNAATVTETATSTSRADEVKEYATASETAKKQAEAVLDLIDEDGTVNDQAELNELAQDVANEIGLSVKVDTALVLMVTGENGKDTKVEIKNAPAGQKLVALLHLSKKNGWEPVKFSEYDGGVIVNLDDWSFLMPLYSVVVEDCDHFFDQKYVAAPTATTWGYTEYRCSICGYTYQSDWVAPLGSAKGASTSPKTEENGFAAAGLFAAAALAGCAAVYVKRKEA